MFKLSTAPRLSLTGFTLASLIALSACSANPMVGSTDTSQPAAGIQLDNCGTQVHIEAPPERVISIKSSTTEMLLALGLGDKIVGSAASDGELPPALADANIPVLSDKVPGKEAVLALEPDLVYAGWESNFSVDGAGERSSLAALGIATYVASSACKAEAYMPNPLTFDDVFNEITTVGQIFDATDQAAALVAQEKAKLAGIVPAASGQTVLWYSSGAADTPYVGAGIGAPQMIMEAAGLTNIAADVEDTWTPMSWEVIVERNPDLIVLVDSSWGPVEQKIKTLESNPATAQLDAVKNKQFLVLPFASTEAGVRNVDAAVDLTEQIAALTAER